MCLKQCNTAQVMLMMSSVMHLDSRALEQALVFVHSGMLSCYNVESVRSDH